MITKFIEDDKIIICVYQNIDLVSIRKMKTYLLHEIELADKNILLDLTKTDYMDSSGLGLLVTAQKELTKKNLTLTIQPSKHILDILKLSSFDRIFNIE
jgi:anti-sigma B factor antagonist